MSTIKDMTFQKPTLMLPRFKTEGWMQYLDSLFSIPAAEIGGAMNMQYPEMVTALAFFNRDKGLDTELVRGFFYGVAMVQMLHMQNQLKFSQPPVFEKNEGDILI